MNETLLKTILKIAVKDMPLAPHTCPVFPAQITKETGASEADLEHDLVELKKSGLIKFIALGANIVELTRTGVETARKLSY